MPECAAKQGGYTLLTFLFPLSPVGIKFTSAYANAANGVSAANRALKIGVASRIALYQQRCSHNKQPGMMA